MGQEPPDRSRAAGEAATPVIAQFLALKEAHPGYLLFFRMGDFYELFFEDAVEAAAALDIALTKRGRHAGKDIPMCGVPAERAEPYLERLIRKGFRVAIAEQTEDPAEARKRGAKAIVAREVVRLITAGTLTEDTLLEARQANYLAAVTPEEEGHIALAWTDLSTGMLAVGTFETARLADALARLDAAELLAPDAPRTLEALARQWPEGARRLTPRPPNAFNPRAGAGRLAAQFKVAALDAFGDFTALETGALAALVDYVDLTQRGALGTLQPPRREADGASMAIDPATRASLELTRTLAGQRTGSLLAAIDRTVTAPGGRLLAERLSAPSCELDVIQARLDAVAFFVERPKLRADIRETLKGLPDMARALSRLALQRGGPRDLAALRDGLKGARALRACLHAAHPDLTGVPEEIGAIDEGLAAETLPLSDALASALVPEAPPTTREGGYIAAGHSPALDELRSLGAEGKRHIAALQGRYVEETSIRALKIKHNNVLGYFVEVPAREADRLMGAPEETGFIHRQTLANAVRFTTRELSELATRILEAGGRALALERELFETLAAQALEEDRRLVAGAEALARLDAASALAELAVSEDHVRPHLDESTALEIDGGRHPVVEQALKRNGERFAANDCVLAGESPGAARARLWLVTGPNMAGKSTFLRQNALIVLMAQMGAFVPARAARIGLVDRLFSRVGAADDIARGRSTFMVEMVETAAILNQAGSRALVILDEIGRGTATFDGLSIAWAAVEHLHDVNGARTLFATHYHELTALADRLEGVATVTMAVKEWRGDLVFLHQVRPGTADRSYGIQVARLAGLPAPVIARARQILTELERGGGPQALRQMVAELPLFQLLAGEDSAETAPTDAADPLAPALVEAVAALDPDAMSPRQAHEALYRLKALLSEAD